MKYELHSGKKGILLDITSMKKLILISLIILRINTFLSGQEETEQARVAVIPPVNTIGNSQYDIIGTTIADTISVTLKLIGNYTVVPVSGAPEDQTISGLASIARELRLDNIIFGTTAEGADESIIFDVSVYDRATDSIIVTHQESAENYFDTFKAADNMVISIVESFSDTHVGWGTILLSNEGSPGAYDIYIDGTILGSSQSSLSNILIGNRNVQLKQDRPFGEFILLDETVNVEEEETVVVPFSIPSLLEAEEDRFQEIDKRIEEAWADSDRVLVEQQFALALTLLGDVSGSSGLKLLKDKYGEWLAAYNVDEIPEDLEPVLGEEEEEEKVVVVESTEGAKEPLRGRRIAGSAMLGLGALLSAGSLIDAVLSAESAYSVEESWNSYNEGSGNLDALYSVYQQDYNRYQTASILTYTFAGAGTALISSSLFLIPEEYLVLSGGGKVAAAAGIVLGAAGNVFHLMANNLRYRSEGLWEDYISATDGLDALYRSYEDTVQTYSAFRIASLSLWGAGLLSFGASFFLPGEVTPAAPTLADKLLLSAGVLLLSGGTVTASMANNYLLASDAAWEDYRNATSNLDSLYTTYTSTLNNYRLTTYLSYGLWGAGAAAILTSLIVPFREPDSVRLGKEKPVELSILPSGRGGLTVNIKGRLP